MIDDQVCHFNNRAKGFGKVNPCDTPTPRIVCWNKDWSNDQGPEQVD